VFDASFNSFGSGAFKKRRIRGKKPRKTTTAIGVLWGHHESEGDVEYSPKPEKYTKSAFKWAKAFSENKSLIHVDFSFNQFKYHDMKILGNTLTLLMRFR
jgi:hypothetical protein